MRNVAVRFIAAFALAFLGPWPGPHIGAYVPIAATLLHGDLADASAAYFVIVAAAIAVYTLVLFGAISLLAYAVRRRTK
jgi:hypothetical protein